MRKTVYFILLFCLIVSFNVQASPIKKVWEITFGEYFPNTVDVNSAGFLGFVNKNNATVLDKDGKIIFKKINTSNDWVIDLSPNHILLQNGGDGEASRLKVYDYKGNKLWEVKESILGMASFSPKGNYIVCSDPSWNDFKIFNIEGQVLFRNSQGSLNVRFDDDDKMLSAMYLGIFFLGNGQITKFTKEEDLGFRREETYFVELGQKILIRESDSKSALKMYDQNLNLIWSKDVKGSISVYDDHIFIRNSPELKILNLNGDQIGLFSLSTEKITSILWASKDFRYMGVMTYTNERKRYFKILSFEGKVLYQEELTLGNLYVFNAEQNLMYTIKNKGKSFTIECFQIVK